MKISILSEATKTVYLAHKKSKWSEPDCFKPEKIEFYTRKSERYKQ